MESFGQLLPNSLDIRYYIFAQFIRNPSVVISTSSVYIHHPRIISNTRFSCQTAWAIEADKLQRWVICSHSSFPPGSGVCAPYERSRSSPCDAGQREQKKVASIFKDAGANLCNFSRCASVCVAKVDFGFVVWRLLFFPASRPGLALPRVIGGNLRGRINVKYF